MLAAEAARTAPPLVGGAGDLRALHKFDKGTTTLAFRYRGGIMVACDSRASQGSFIASQTVRKIIEIDEHILGTMAGGAADCSFWERVLASYCKMVRLQTQKPITVRRAAKYLTNIFDRYRGYGLCCGTMIAGFDPIAKDTQLFYVDDKGLRLPGNLYSVGSGSQYALGVLASGYRWDLTDEQALALARKAIFHAGKRDAASGGVVRVYRVTARGWEKLIEAADFFDLYKEIYAA